MTTVQTLRLIGHGLLDLVYPPRCLICGSDGEWSVCEDCYQSFTPIPEPVCERCGRPRDTAACRFCATHARATGGLDWAFAGARAASIYDGPLRHAIHALKYRGVEALGEPLGAHLANRCVADELIPTNWWPEIDAVLPMPIHPTHRRRRGYNQAELIARPLAAMAGRPLLPKAIQRVGRRTAAQVGLTLNARRGNVAAAAFAVPDPVAIDGKHLLLVDDVFTTGTSVNACATALCAAGAASVRVVTLAAGD
jgi:ComF family protein